MGVAITVIYDITYYIRVKLNLIGSLQIV